MPLRRADRWCRAGATPVSRLSTARPRLPHGTVSGAHRPWSSETRLAYQGSCSLGVHVLVSSRAQAAGQRHRPETYPNQPAHGTSHRLEKPPHLAIAALAEDDVEPSVHALSSRRSQRFESRFTIAQGDPSGQRFECLGARGAPYPYCVLAFDSGAWVHESVGQLTVVGEQEQPGGVEVQPADRDPSGSAELREPVEHRRSRERVAARRYLAGRLVVADESASRGRPPYDIAIDTQHVTGRHSISEGGGTPVDGDPAGDDPALGFAP